MEMPVEAEQHLNRVLAESMRRIDAKYRAGQAEHGGCLPRAGVGVLLDSAVDEAVDQLVYLLTLRELLTGTERDRK
jgi:hypothetical protein